MRGATILLLLAAAAAAGPDPFAPTREELQIDDAAYARYVETLALLKESLDRDPAGSLERAVLLLENFGFGERFEEPVAKALAAATEEGPRRAALLSLYGHLVVARCAQGDNIVWIFGPGNAIQRQELDAETKKLLETAVELLREAIRLRPKDVRAREDIATALETLDAEKHKDEIQKLRMEATATRLDGMTPPPKPPPDPCEQLRHDAEQLEQKETGPDHAAALLLRKQAFVTDFCARTIPFEYDATLYGPLSVLAPEDLIIRNLTRTYRKLDGTIDSVPPSYHPAKPAQRVKAAEGLGRDTSAAAGAALVKLLAISWERDAVADAALRALVAGKHEAVRKHLPALLGRTVCTADPMDAVIDGLQARLRELRNRLRAMGVEPPAEEQGSEFGPIGQALLVEAAAALEVREAAPVLAALLPLDNDLVHPRGIARALGAIGGTEHADALLAMASDPLVDVWFRREAVLALGRIATARLAEVPAEPSLELALAAAQYRAAPTEALRGRLLQGLARTHEADDAARYLLELNVREAIPDLEMFLATNPGHYAAGVVQDALDRLRKVG